MAVKNQEEVHLYNITYILFCTGNGCEESGKSTPV